MAVKKTSQRNNREILTGGSKYRNKQAKKFGVEEVVFDKDARQEYLTGFHKRKLERQKKAKKFHEEQDRLAKIAERKQMREEKQRDFETKFKELESAKDLDISEILRQEQSDEEWGGFGGDDKEEASTKESSESDSDDKPLRGILQKKQVYKIDNPEALGDAVVDEETTVTVETLENPDFARVGQSSLDLLAQSNNVNLGKSEEVLEKSIERAKKYAVVCGVSKPEKPKQKKKKFRYLTKAERRDNNRKAKASKLKSRTRE